MLGGTSSNKLQIYKEALSIIEKLPRENKELTVNDFLYKMQAYTNIKNEVLLLKSKSQSLTAQLSEVEEKIKMNKLLNEYYDKILNPLKTSFKTEFMRTAVERFVEYLTKEVNNILKQSSFDSDNDPILIFDYKKMVDDDGKNIYKFVAKVGRNKLQRNMLPISQLSSGERAMLSLAIFCSLYKIIGVRIPFLFLDEPTQCLDAYNIQRLANMIKYLQQSVVNQIFIITHHKELVDNLTGVHVLDCSK
jgi:DNA repair exonuclease SbcCD ATPase subunit